MSAHVSRHERRHGAASPSARREVDRLLGAARAARAAGSGPSALRLYERVLAIDPSHVDALCHYSNLATQLGRPDVGIEVARRAATLQAGHADAHHCMGVALRQIGQPNAALQAFARALELAPQQSRSMLELCMTLLDLGDVRAAEPFLEKALEIEPGTAAAEAALGRFYAQEGRLDDAMAAFGRAVTVDEGHAEAHVRLGNLLRDAGQAQRAIASFERALCAAPNRSDLHSGLLLTLQCAPEVPPSLVAERHRAYGRHFSALLRPFPAVRPSVDRASRLKIGYVSSSFRRHAVAKFFEQLAAFHDRARFEVHCYYNYPTADEMTERIASHVEHFASICGLRDGHVAAQVRRDGIDVLVDLDGHTAPNRLPVFFLRPAPVQVTWLGYLGTTGVPAIDYRLTDGWADPPGATDALHTETLWRLPRTAWCYAPYEEAPPVVASRHTTDVTFVSLNNPGKVNDSLLEWWERIMSRVPGSRLMLHASPQQSRTRGLERHFAAHGVDPERLVILQRQSIADYLATFASADIALDTWPCAGGTTTCDALWMGVPVIALTGESSYSRTGASLLASVALSDLVARTPEEYVATAVALANDARRRAHLRATLRERMLASPLMDGPGFARAVEDAYLNMWAQRTRGKARGR